jgi:hypothetical protein
MKKGKVKTDAPKKMGRPRVTPEGSATITISLPRTLIPKLKALGFSRWIAEKIREEISK